MVVLLKKSSRVDCGKAMVYFLYLFFRHSSVTCYCYSHMYAYDGIKNAQKGYFEEKNE